MGHLKLNDYKGGGGAENYHGGTFPTFLPICLADLSYSPQAISGLPTTSYTMKNYKPFCTGENLLKLQLFLQLGGLLLKSKLERK